MLVGDVMVDALAMMRARVAHERRALSARPSRMPGLYLLATVHRAETTDDPARLAAMLNALAACPLPVWLLAHPRLADRARRLGLALVGRFACRPAIPCLTPAMIAAMAASRGIVTDSGGLQKEALLLGVPCTTLRDRTEWPETLQGGWNVLVPRPSDLAVAVSRPRPPGEPPHLTVTAARPSRGRGTRWPNRTESGATMKIWILNHYASSPDRPAGTRHYEFGRLFAEQGHEVTIFASSFSHFTRQEERLSGSRLMRVEWVDGVRFVWVRTVPYTR